MELSTMKIRPRWISDLSVLPGGSRPKVDLMALVWPWGLKTDCDWRTNQIQGVIDQ